MASAERKAVSNVQFSMERMVPGPRSTDWRGRSWPPVRWTSNWLRAERVSAAGRLTVRIRKGPGGEAARALARAKMVVPESRKQVEAG